MGKDHKIVFNLSLKDLKQLGILKTKRRKRRKTNKTKTIKDSVYANQTRTPPNLNGYAFTNQISTNADTDRLKNELVQLQIQQAKENKPLTIENPKLLQIENDLQRFRNSQNELGYSAGYAYNQHENRFNKLEDQIRTLALPPMQTMDKTSYVNKYDNIDVPSQNDPNFMMNSYGVPTDEILPETQPIKVIPQKTPSSGINWLGQQPFSAFFSNNNENESEQEGETPEAFKGYHKLYKDLDQMILNKDDDDPLKAAGGGNESDIMKKLEEEDDDDDNDEEPIKTVEKENIVDIVRRSERLEEQKKQKEQALITARRNYTILCKKLGIQRDKKNIHSSENIDVILNEIKRLKAMKK
jgi:hypothetical protein